jgi:uncharacterized membrane protein YphA (DoxX/SURF4 family)
MKILRFIIRLITGLVFMFSGIVKAIDPLGSAYKFHDYFQAFNLQFLVPFALPLAILLCTAEFISGFSVLSGYRQKTGIIGVMILMLIFTPLTFVLALTNPVSDCGCFGDAIHLTNWQTFGKNIVLMIFAIILFAGRNRVVKVFKPLKEWNLTGIMIIVFIVFSLLNLKYLPLIDFLPYKPGVNIAEGMKIPQGVPSDKYETTFIYEKDGVEKEFTLENYPASDTSWKFIDQKSVLVKKGYQPPIHDFSISIGDGSDITDQILSDKGFTLLLISKKLEEAKASRLEAGFDLGNYCIENGISFYVVTASGSDIVNKFNNGPVFCTADETTLKTIVRANPGYLLISNGNIAGKWSWANVPEKEEFSSGNTPNHFANLNNRTYKIVVIIAGLAVIMFLLLTGVLQIRKRK